MITVAFAGLAVLDRVFHVPTLPARAGKHFASAYREVMGGIAANAAAAVVRLGGEARLHGRLGDDDTGRTLEDALARAGVDTSRMEVVAGRLTPHSAVFVDAGGERLIVNHKDPALFDGEPALDLKGAAAAMADLRWPQATSALARAARAGGLPMVLDVDQAPETDAVALGEASHLVFGADALASLTGTATPRDGLASMAARAPEASLAVTTGPGGVHWRLPCGRAGHVAAHRVEVVDTLGAGDVFHGAAALALGEGRSFEQALVFANAVAALKVARPSGIETLPTRAETEMLIRSSA